MSLLTGINYMEISERQLFAAFQLSVFPRIQLFKIDAFGGAVSILIVCYSCNTKCVVWEAVTHLCGRIYLKCSGAEASISLKAQRGKRNRWGFRHFLEKKKNSIQWHTESRSVPATLPITNPNNGITIPLRSHKDWAQRCSRRGVSHKYQISVHVHCASS